MTTGHDILSREELQARALELARIPSSDDDRSEGEIGLLTVQLGHEWYSVPVELVQEVVRDPIVTALPGVPAFVAGVINLRGEILCALNLGLLFGLATQEAPIRYAVLVNHNGLEAALLADNLTDVIWKTTADQQPVVSTVPADKTHFFSGVFRDGRRLITSLRVEEIFNQPELAKLR